MHELLTGKIRLERHKDPWVTTTLGEVSGFVNGYTFKSSTYTENGSYMVITIANVQDGQMVIDEPKTIRDLPENINKDQVLQKGDLLIFMTGNVGRVCIVDRNFCLLNQRVGKIKERGLSRELLYFILNDRRFLNKMIDSAQGGAQGNLSTTDIKKYSFKIPKSKEEQHDITNILTTANNEIRILERKFNILQGQKKYLLNNLITGTIRTPENLLVS